MMSTTSTSPWVIGPPNKSWEYQWDHHAAQLQPGEFYGGSFLLSGQKDLPTGTNLFLDPMAVVTEFSLYGRQKKKFSDLAENGTNRLDDIKSGPNLVSDQKVDFLKN